MSSTDSGAASTVMTKTAIQTLDAASRLAHIFDTQAQRELCRGRKKLLKNNARGAMKHALLCLSHTVDRRDSGAVLAQYIFESATGLLEALNSSDSFDVELETFTTQIKAFQTATSWSRSGSRS